MSKNENGEIFWNIKMQSLIWCHNQYWNSERVPGQNGDAKFEKLNMNKKSLIYINVIRLTTDPEIQTQIRAHSTVKRDEHVRTHVAVNQSCFNYWVGWMTVSQCDVVTQLHKYNEASTGCVSIVENNKIKLVDEIFILFEYFLWFYLSALF